MHYNHDKPLGIVLSTVTDSSLSSLINLAQHAEKCGLDSVYVNEGRGDALGVSLAIALKTRKIGVGTNIANIYFRTPYLAAQSIRILTEASRGRARIGFGISHRDILRSIGIEMGDARAKLEQYITTVKSHLRKSHTDNARQEKTPPTSIFAAANTAESAKVAGKVADGIMPYLTPVSSIHRLIQSTNLVSTRAIEPKDFKCILSIPTFISENEKEAVSAAKYNLAFFANLPNYRRQWRRAGFSRDMDIIKENYQNGSSRRDIAGLISMDLVEEVCIYGNSKQCRKKIEAFRAQGVTEPVAAISPVSQNRYDATLKGIEELAPQRL